MRPILEVDVKFLENKFVNGYREGGRILYMFPYDKDGKTMDIRDVDIWEEH